MLIFLNGIILYAGDFFNYGGCTFIFLGLILLVVYGPNAYFVKVKCASTKIARGVFGGLSYWCTVYINEIRFVEKVSVVNLSQNAIIHNCVVNNNLL